MISLTTPTYDIQGDLIINTDPKTTFGTLSRRNTRTATLDGESVLTDLGYSYSDMVLTIEASVISQGNIDHLKYLLINHPVLYISTKEGVFLGTIKGLDSNVIPVSFNFLPIKKVSA